MTGDMRPVRGKTPWQSRHGGDDPRQHPAPRQAAPYLCERRGCQFTVTFLAGIAPPAEWDCRCGVLARYAGDLLTSAPTVTVRQVRRLDEKVGHDHLLLQKRRPRADLETLLAEPLNTLEASRLAQRQDRRIGRVAERASRPGPGRPARGRGPRPRDGLPAHPVRTALTFPAYRSDQRAEAPFS